MLIWKAVSLKTNSSVVEAIHVDGLLRYFIENTANDTDLTTFKNTLNVVSVNCCGVIGKEKTFTTIKRRALSSSKTFCII